MKGLHLILVILATSLHTGIGQNILEPENPDLISIESKYYNYDELEDEANQANYNDEGIQDILEDNAVMIFEELSETKLQKICEESDAIIQILKANQRVDCEDYRRGGNPTVLHVNTIKKRSIFDDLDEGSGAEPEPENVNNNTMDNSEDGIPLLNEENEEPATTLIDELVETTVSIFNEEDSKVETTVSSLSSAAAAAAEEEEEEHVVEEKEIAKVEVHSDKVAPMKIGLDLTPQLHETGDKTSEEVGQEIVQVPISETGKGKSLLNKTPEGEEPAVDESTKTAGKDTSILIFLFVAVVAVGALAFAYNFIKKRKQQSADLETVERSQQQQQQQSKNLPKPLNEQEMKPLINQKQEPVIEQEMVEIKKAPSSNGQTPPTGEKTDNKTVN